MRVMSSIGDRAAASLPRSSAVRSSRWPCRRSQRTTRSWTRLATSSTSVFAGGGASWKRTPSPAFSKTPSTATSPVRVCVQTAAESLEVRDEAGLGGDDVHETLRGARDLLGEETSDRRAHVGLGRDEGAKVEGHRHHPLADRDAREDAIGDVRGLVAHAPPGAARAHAAGLAREGDEDVVAARASVAAHEATGEVPAGEVALEGVDHVARQRRGVGGFGVLEEGREVLTDEAMKDGVVGAAGRVRGGDAGHAPAAQTACRRDSTGFRVETQPESMAAPWRRAAPLPGAPNKPMKLAGFACSLSSVVGPAEKRQ